MAFSQSFEFGNSTFMKLESAVRQLDNNKQKSNNKGLHSSRNQTKQPNRDTNSLTTTQLTRTLPKDTSEHYSQYFQDEFSIKGSDANALHQTGAKTAESLLQMSQIEAIFSDSAFETSAENVVSVFEAQICSEDLHDLESETEVAEKPTDDQLDPINLDESSFVCPPKDVIESQQLQQQLIRSRCKLDLAEEYSYKSSAKEPSYNSPRQSKNTTKEHSFISPKQTQNLSNMSLGQLQLSPDTTNETSENKAITNTIDVEGLKHITAWNLPHSVLSEYKKKGVIQMFDWQVECLSKPKVLFEHCNLVYSAPTSAGKTLVSEILLLKTVLERNKKGLLILPFVSVVREKMLYLQDLLTPAGYRVEGFYGGYTPPGGFENSNVAVCTIEKANTIINKLLEHGKLDEIGTVVVDEVHLICDAGRGYILELLLAKLLYMSRKHGLEIQVITMSATLANVQLLQRWLDAELYITDFRPVALQEMIKVGNEVFDNKLRLLRDVSKGMQSIPNDADHVSQLCLETLLEGCSVIVFCPSKVWCENLAMQLAKSMHTIIKSESDLAQRLRDQIDMTAIEEVKQQLRDIPTGLDATLAKTITYACAFHHAGLTTEERDIVESSFKAGALKVIVATSTLSSGVNLPARRVLIRTPLFSGKAMNALTYRQMIGRAGRTGKDTLGESILICNESNARIGRELITTDLKPISSCLDQDSSAHLKRALLEVISSGVASTKQDIDSFYQCTLLATQKALSKSTEDDEVQHICDALDFLLEYEFIRLQTDEDGDKLEHYVATRLGTACLASSIPPKDGLILFAELQKSRRCFVLESELHAVYLVTPYSVSYQLQDLDWLLYLDMWEKLSPAMKKVGELVGVKESLLVRAMRDQSKLDYNTMQIFKRFYTALALQELVNETPINIVAHKFKCGRGLLQSLQQMASTFAGVVSAFCNALQWSTLSLIVSQFKERLFFGIHHELIDLTRLPDLSQKRARALHNAGITSLVELAGASVLNVEKVLFNSLSFDSAKQREQENEYEAAQRNAARHVFITGKAQMTVTEAAKLLIAEARQFVQYEIGVDNIKWTQEMEEKNTDSGVEGELHMSLEDDQRNFREIKRKSLEANKIEKPLSCKTRKVETVDGQPKESDVNKEEGLASKTEEQLPAESSPCVDNKTQKIGQIRISIRSSKDISEKLTEKGLSAQVEKSPQSPVLRPLTPAQNNLNQSEINVADKPNTSTEVRKRVLMKEIAQRREKALSRIKQRSEQLKELTENSPKPTIQENKENVNSKVEQIAFKAPTVNSGSPAQRISTPINMPRRSPRNHPTPTNTFSNTTNIEKTRADVDLFMDDDSFMLNTGVTEAITAAESKSSLTKIDRNENGGETPNFQPVQLDAHESQSKPTSPQVELSYASSSLEICDLSQDNSLLKNPQQLNASHIMSCSKTDETAGIFTHVDIVDICGNVELFDETMKELHAAQSCGCSIGLQHQVGKAKPIIGSNLLLNQMGAAQQRNAAKDTDVLFQVDDDHYLSCISFCFGGNAVYYMDMQRTENISTEQKIRELQHLLARSNLTLLMNDAKDQLKMLCQAIPDLKNITVNVEDPKIGNWLLQPDKILSIAEMCRQYAPECSALSELCGAARGQSSYGMDASSAIITKARASIEACITSHILKGQIENLQRIGDGELLKFFREVEMPIQLSLCRMECFGFPAQGKLLHLQLKKMFGLMQKTEAKIYTLHGSKFNLSSSKDVAKVLGLHRKSNGRVSTSREILEKLDSPIAGLIMSYRKLHMTITNTIQPLLKACKNNRVYGKSISLTATGRISMCEPNLQNVAKDFDVNLGPEVESVSCRSAFAVMDEKTCLLSADFCQLEMRILAHLSQDDALLKVMNSKKDLFTAIAAHWNKINESEVTEPLRNGTKQICYGIVYGMGMRSLSQELKCTEQEAKSICDQFHAAYPGIRAYAVKVQKFANNNGYVETITGRRRYLNHINSERMELKKQAERQALNTTIQGSAADIAKSAILRMEKNMDKYHRKMKLAENAVNLVLHLHDELIFEVPTERAKKIAKVLQITMENCAPLSVPLKVKLKIGPSWGKMQEIKV